MTTRSEANYNRIFQMYSLMAHVVRTAPLIPRMRRVTLGGESMRTLVGGCQPADAVKLYLPLPGQSAVQPKFISLPGRGKQYNIRPYTIRRFDPNTLELDIDVLLHGDSPGSVWARTVQPGDEVGFIGPRHDYRVPHEVDWQLLAGDESALPAIAAVLESLPVGSRAFAWIEVNDVADELPIETKAEVQLSWLHRGSQAAASSGLLEQTLRSFTLPVGRGHIWMAGHAQTAKNIRRYLLEERQLSKDTVTTMGYWR